MDTKISNKIYRNNDLQISHFVACKGNANFLEIKHAFLLTNRDWTVKTIIRSYEYKKFIKFLNNALEWLNGTIPNIYGNEENEKFVARKLDTKCILDSKTSIIAIPCIITDKFKMSYEGISLIQGNRLIGHLTGEELEQMLSAITEVTDSAYSASVSMAMKTIK